MLSYLVFILTIGAIYALLSQGLVLSWGWGGMVNLGLVGFFAIGAYTSAGLTKTLGLPVFAGLFLGSVAGGIVGLLVALSTLRLREDYLAIVTLGFAEVIRLIASNEIWLSGGTDGISGIPSLFDRSGGLASDVKFLGVVTMLCIICSVLLTRLGKSPWGRVLRAIRDDQVVAAVAGKHVTRYKAQAFTIGSGMAALGGALYGSYISYIAPDLFEPLITMYIFLAVTAGGNTRPMGATLGAYVLVLWLEASRFLGAILPDLSAVQVAALQQIVIGAGLVIILRLAPGGLFREINQKAPRASGE